METISMYAATRPPTGTVVADRAVCVPAEPRHGMIGWRAVNCAEWQKVIYCLGRGWLSFDEWSELVMHDPRICPWA